MPKFMISFDAHAMDHVPDDDMPSVADAAHAVVQAIVNAGAYVVAGGLENRRADLVAPDGVVTEGPERDAVGGFTIVEVPSREEAIAWAAEIAVACRCAQEVWEIQDDPTLEAMLHDARK